MSAEVVDKKSAMGNAIKRFRKDSIDMGAAVNVDDFKLLAKPVQDFEAFVDEFIDVVNGCKGNLENTTWEFCDRALKGEDKVAKEILRALHRR